jgi:hypothetical protein
MRPPQALGLAILAAADHPDYQQDGANRNRDEEQQDEYLNGSHLNQLPVAITVKSRRLHAGADYEVVSGAPPPAVDAGRRSLTTSRSTTRRRRTSSSSITNRLIVARPIASRPITTARSPPAPGRPSRSVHEGPALGRRRRSLARAWHPTSGACFVLRVCARGSPFVPGSSSIPWRHRRPATGGIYRGDDRASISWLRSYGRRRGERVRSDIESAIDLAVRAARCASGRLVLLPREQQRGTDRESVPRVARSDTRRRRWARVSPWLRSRREPTAPRDSRCSSRL